MDYYFFAEDLLIFLFVTVPTVIPLVFTLRRWRLERRFSGAAAYVGFTACILLLLLLPTVGVLFIGMNLVVTLLLVIAAAALLFMLTKREPAVLYFLSLSVLFLCVAVFGAVPARFGPLMEILWRLGLWR